MEAGLSGASGIVAATTTACLCNVSTRLRLLYFAHFDFSYLLISRFLCLGFGSEHFCSVCCEADFHGPSVMVFGEEGEEDRLRSRF